VSDPAVYPTSTTRSQNSRGHAVSLSPFYKLRSRDVRDPGLFRSHDDTEKSQLLLVDSIEPGLASEVLADEKVAEPAPPSAEKSQAGQAGTQSEVRSMKLETISFFLAEWDLRL
jgi:hypothetical protein